MQDYQSASESTEKIESNLKKFSKAAKKYDKSVLNELVAQESKLRDAGINIGKDENNARNNTKYIDIYFSGPQKFKEFRKKISNTIKQTDKQLKGDKTKDYNKDTLYGVNYNLEYAERDHGKRYWNYLDATKDNSVKNQIIGRENLKRNDKGEPIKEGENFIKDKRGEDMGEYIGKLIFPPKEGENENDTNEGNNGTQPKGTNQENSNSDSNSSSSISTIDVKNSIDELKNLPLTYDQNFEKKQEEIEKMCREDITKLKRFGISITIPDATNFLVALDDNILDKKRPLPPIAPPALKKEVPASTNQNATTETATSPNSPAAPTSTENSTNIASNENKAEANSVQENLENSQENTVNSEKKEENNPDNVPKEKPTQRFSLDNISINNTNPVDAEKIKNEIITHYKEQLHQEHLKLAKAFIEEQRKIFAKLPKDSELSGKKDDNIIDSLTDLESISKSLYNFNISNFFKNKLLHATPPEKPDNTQSNKDNKVEEPTNPSAPAADSQKTTQEEKNEVEAPGPSSDQTTNNQEPNPKVENAKNEQATNPSIPEGEDNDDNQNTKNQNNTAEQDQKSFSSEDVLDVLLGRIFQSTFLKEVGLRLTNLYKYMELAEDVDVKTDKKDSTKQLSFDEDTIKEIILSTSPTGEFNLYNLRLMYQKERNTKYLKNQGINDEDIDKYNTKYFEDKSDEEDEDDKKLSGDSSNPMLMFKYTRALLRAYICIKNNLKIEPRTGTTNTNNLNDNNQCSTLYKSFFDKCATNSGNVQSMRNACTQIINDVEKACRADISSQNNNNKGGQSNNSDNKNKYEALLDFMNNVKIGRYYFSELKEAIKNGLPKDNYGPNSAREMLEKKTWLYRGEGSTEYNIDINKIVENFKKQKS